MDPLELLSDMLRVDSSSPAGEDEIAQMLESALASAGMQTAMYKSPGGRTSVVGRAGGGEKAAALVLLSHTDVVGVEPDRWSRDPFGGEIHDGAMWGRGALDMKSVAAMHVAAAAAAAEGVAREVIVACVADEERGGAEGARWLLERHPDAVGFGDDRPPPEVLGEGAYGISGLLPVDVMPVALGEKSSLWIDLVARGDPGHGSLPPGKQAPLNLVRTITGVAGFGRARVHPVMRTQFAALAAAVEGPRSVAFRALASGAGGAAARVLAPRLKTLRALLCDTATLTMLGGGYQHNVVPGEARAALDCRLLPDTDPDEYLARVRRVADVHGVEVTAHPPLRGGVSDAGPALDALGAATRRQLGEAVVMPTLCPGITDLRYFRARGARGYGWIPLVLTPELLGTIHGHDERVPVDGFTRAVDAMSDAVATLVAA